MADSTTASTDGITRGYRIANFALPAQDERTLLFYEFATGKPMLLAACARTWAEEDRERFVEAVHERAERRDIQAVVLSEGPSSIVHPPGTATAVDADGALRRRLFGPLIEGSEGALVMADPNLRVIDGATVEQTALATPSLVSGIDALVTGCLTELAAENEVAPAVAPVLVVPRVLAPELCRGLIANFEAWNAQPSPMPQADGGGLAVDTDRKSRLDVMIEDSRLEKELTAAVARRVLPEISKAFHYPATRFERLKLVCYRASDSGHFGAHRDNTSPTTAHRRFALTLNLNAGDYDGGSLEFPEYGTDCAYDVPAGTALVFSCAHAHRVQPVTRGDRYALISFIFGEEAFSGQGRAREPSR